MPDAQVLAELTGMLVAGHEVLGQSLAWALQLLAAHPEQQVRVCVCIRVCVYALVCVYVCVLACVCACVSLSKKTPLAARCVSLRRHHIPLVCPDTLALFHLLHLDPSSPVPSLFVAWCAGAAVPRAARRGLCS